MEEGGGVMDGWMGRADAPEAQPAQAAILLLLTLVMLMLVLLLAGWQIAVGAGGRCCGGVWRAYHLMCVPSWH